MELCQGFVKNMGKCQVLPKICSGTKFLSKIWKFDKFCQKYGSWVSFAEDMELCQGFAKNMEICQVLRKICSGTKLGVPKPWASEPS